MRITRERKLTVRMGDYETYTFGVFIGVDHNDLGVSDDTLADMPAADRQQHRKALQSLANEQLDLALQAEIEDSAYLTKDKKSFIHRVIADD